VDNVNPQKVQIQQGGHIGRYIGACLNHSKPGSSRCASIFTLFVRVPAQVKYKPRHCRPTCLAEEALCTSSPYTDADTTSDAATTGSAVLASWV